MGFFKTTSAVAVGTLVASVIMASATVVFYTPIMKVFTKKAMAAVADFDFGTDD